ncbi:hypothetical protein R0G64_32705, partial [Pseudomonas otitidis]|nr:hypothetical protein [Pseudomonas otitidis]
AAAHGRAAELLQGIAATGQQDTGRKQQGERASRPLKNVNEVDDARRKRPKKRSLRGVNEHFEGAFNAASA